MAIRNIGIDLGFGFVKATNGEQQYIFPSVVGAGLDLTYRSELTMYIDPIQNLTVTVDGKKYFVGDLAIRQSEIVSRSLSENHAQEKNTKILLLAALALYVHGDSEEFNVVTGLPPSYYLANKDILAQVIKGPHIITINVDGMERKKTIVVNNVKIIPQPMGTLFHKLFDAKGVIADKELSRSKVGIIDVGFRTTDFSVVDKLEYIDKLSYSTATGMANAYGIMAEHLRNQYRIYKENYELEEIIQKGQIKVAGKVHSLDQVKKDIFEQVSAKILTEMNSIWDIRDLDAILLSGGGGKMLADYLLPELGIATLMEEAQMANVNGYLKLGHKLFGYSEAGLPSNSAASQQGNSTGTPSGAGATGNHGSANPGISGSSNTGAALNPRLNSHATDAAVTSAATTAKPGGSENRFANSKFFEKIKPVRQESIKR
ncbi:MAG TPA: ParM/StbA family protein [Bacillota bacterium]